MGVATPRARLSCAAGGGEHRADVGGVGGGARTERGGLEDALLDQGVDLRVHAVSDARSADSFPLLELLALLQAVLAPRLRFSLAPALGLVLHQQRRHLGRTAVLVE